VSCLSILDVDAFSPGERDAFVRRERDSTSLENALSWRRAFDPEHGPEPVQRRFYPDIEEIVMRAGFLGLMMLTGLAVSSANAADPEHGRTIATRWCAACHVVAPEQTQAKADAPPFASIAKSKTAANLRLFLADPSPRMPNMSLSRDEIADLVVYIKTMGLAPDETPEPPPPAPDTPGRDHRG
jgi:mono/diheme cytochrome c family protein